METLSQEEDKMQNTIMSRRISYNLVALIVTLVALAMIVGFAAGLVVSTPSAASTSPSIQPSDYAVRVVVPAPDPLQIDQQIQAQDSRLGQWANFDKAQDACRLITPSHWPVEC